MRRKGSVASITDSLEVDIKPRLGNTRMKPRIISAHNLGLSKRQIIANIAFDHVGKVNARVGPKERFPAALAKNLRSNPTYNRLKDLELDDLEQRLDEDVERAIENEKVRKIPNEKRGVFSRLNDSASRKLWIETAIPGKDESKIVEDARAYANGTSFPRMKFDSYDVMKAAGEAFGWKSCQLEEEVYTRIKELHDENLEKREPRKRDLEDKTRERRPSLTNRAIAKQLSEDTGMIVTARHIERLKRESQSGEHSEEKRRSWYCSPVAVGSERTLEGYIAEEARFTGENYLDTKERYASKVDQLMREKNGNVGKVVKELNKGRRDQDVNKKIVRKLERYHATRAELSDISTGMQLSALATNVGKAYEEAKIGNHHQEAARIVAERLERGEFGNTQGYNVGRNHVYALVEMYRRGPREKGQVITMPAIPEQREFAVLAGGAKRTKEGAGA